MLTGIRGSIAALAILSLLLSARASTQPALPRDQVVTLIYEPGTLSPLFDSRFFWAAMYMVDVQRNDAFKLFPQGVEYLPSLRDGTWTVEGETMVLRWRLKPRNWSDGRPVTCADYVFTIRLIQDQRLQATGDVDSDAQRFISNVSCPAGAGGREISVVWKRRTPIAGQTIVGAFPLPRHVVQTFYRRNPGRLHEAPFAQDPTVTVTDGPYRPVEWRRGHSITLQAVEGHPIFGTPRIKRIVLVGEFTVQEDSPEELALLLSGKVDVMSGGGWTSMLEIARRRVSSLRLISSPTANVENMTFNLANPLLQDVRVRRAIAYAVNRTAIIQQVYGGFGQVAHTYLPPSHPGYISNVPRYPYDPARARALLKEAGFTPGADGIMRSVDGRRLSLEFTTTAGLGRREEVQRLIQRQLLQLGIELTIVNFPRRVFFREILARRKFDLALFTWIMTPPWSCGGLYTSEAIPTEGNGWRGINYGGYRNAEMDTQCGAADRELDGERRAQMQRQTALVYSRELPALPLYILNVVAAVKVGLENYRPVWISPGSWIWNVHTWYWR